MQKKSEDPKTIREKLEQAQAIFNEQLEQKKSAFKPTIPKEPF